MAADKKVIKKSNGQLEGAINATTGNIIARDASSGRLVVIKEDNQVEFLTISEMLPKYVIKEKKDTKKEPKGGLTANKRKAEKAEQVVLSYLNKAQK